MLDERVIFKYFEEIESEFPKKIAKDIKVEIDYDSNFPDRKDYIAVNFYYRDMLVLSAPYCMDQIICRGSIFNFEEDVTQLKSSLKNWIFQQYCDNIPE